MSISKKFLILYSISFTLILTIGFWINSINNKVVDNLAKEKYLKIANDLLLNFDNIAKIEDTMRANNLKFIKTQDNDPTDNYFYSEHTFGFISIDKEILKGNFLIHVNFLDKDLVMQTPIEKDINAQHLLNGLIFTVVFLLLFILLYSIKLLKPLKNITKEIENFSKGEFHSRVQIQSQDEIGVLAKSFNQMATTIEDMIKTREELLRDIGHELRTPIAKGLFAVEEIDDFSKKDLLKRVFSDLQRLTSTLIELEKLNSHKFEKTNFSTETLILETFNRLYIENENLITLEIEKSFQISADFEYLVMALKNLVDNAFKYASKLPIKIVVGSNYIEVCNYGDALSKEFAHYLRAFTQEKQNRDGFGLGLSIVDKILVKHQFVLDYEHKENQNCFKIIFSK